MADGDGSRSGVQIDNHGVDDQEVDKHDAEPIPPQASAETQDLAETQNSAGTGEYGAGADVEDEAARADAERAAREDARHRDTPADAMVTDPADPASANGGDARPAQDTGGSAGTAEMPPASADAPGPPRNAGAGVAADARMAADADAGVAADAGARTTADDEAGMAADADALTAAEAPARASTEAASPSESTMDNVTETTAAGSAQDLAPGDVSMESVPDLWSADAISALRERWREVQLRFVDDPSAAATEADALVGEAIETLQTQLAMQRTDLAAWRTRDGGGDDTERLRVAVQRYREFLDRVLGV